MMCVLMNTTGMIIRWFFFFNDTATTEIYTLSLHDALPICVCSASRVMTLACKSGPASKTGTALRSSRLRATCSWASTVALRSEEHTSELQSRQYLVCRLLLEKKKKKDDFITSHIHPHSPYH